MVYAMLIDQYQFFMNQTFFLETPIGRIGIVENGTAITHVFFGSMTPPQASMTGESALLRQAAAQVEEYFHGTRRTFDLPLAPQGTEFEQSVWKALQSIPYGETRSYGDIAHQLGKPGAHRAVGRANGLNPLGIIIPCHRVIGSNGRLTGYAGGLKIKEYLLELEQGAVSTALPFPDSK